MEYDLEHQRLEILKLFETYLRAEDPKKHSIRGFSKYLDKTTSYIYSFFKNCEDLYHELYVYKIGAFDDDFDIKSYSPINEIVIFTIKLIEYFFNEKDIIQAIDRDIQYAHLRKYLYERYYMCLVKVKEQATVTIKADEETVTDLLVYLFIGFLEMNTSLSKEEAINLSKKTILNFITTYFK